MVGYGNIDIVLYIPLVYEGGQSGLTYKIRIRAESNVDQIRPEVILNGRENEPHLSGWTWKGWEGHGEQGERLHSLLSYFTNMPNETLLMCQVKCY
jgi:hypothetical protein